MRCPRCQASFTVAPTGTVAQQQQASSTGTIAGPSPQPKVAKPPPPPAPKPIKERTVAGQGPVGQKPTSGIAIPPHPQKSAPETATILGVGSQRDAAIATSSATDSANSPSNFGDEIDLPAPQVKARTKKDSSEVDDTKPAGIDLPGLPKTAADGRKLVDTALFDRDNSQNVDLPGLPDSKAKTSVQPLTLELDEQETEFGDLDLPDLPARKTESRAQSVPEQSSTNESHIEEFEFEDLPALKRENAPQTETFQNDETDFSDIDSRFRERSEENQKSTEYQFQDDIPAVSFDDRETLDLPKPKTIPSVVDGLAKEPDGLADADLPELARPEINADGLIPKESFDLPQYKRDSEVDSDFGAIELPLPKAKSTRPQSPRHGTMQGYPSTPSPRPLTETEAVGEFELPDALSLEDIASVKPPRIPSKPAAATRPFSPARPDSPSTVPQFSIPPEGDNQDDASFDLGDTRFQLSDPAPSGLDNVKSEPRNETSLASDASAPPQIKRADSTIGEELDWGADPEDPEMLGESKDAHGRTGVGSANFGEVDLGAESFGDLDTGLQDEMEFGIPDLDPVALDQAAMGLPPDILRRQRGIEFEAKREARARKTLKIAIRIGVVLLVIAGAGLSLGLTEHGVFGIYYFERYLPSAGTTAIARNTIKKAEKRALTDTYRDVRKSLSILGKARARIGLNRQLLTRSLVHESLFIVRFGQHSPSSARAAAIVKRLQERHLKAPGIDLALAAEALQRADLSQAQNHLQKARAKNPSDAYAELIAGELALRQNKLDVAKGAFEKALRLGGGARAQWGIARAIIRRGGDANERQEAIEETLRLSPLHEDAQVAYARVLIEQGKESEAEKTLRQAVGIEPIEGTFLHTSKLTKAAGYSALGYLHELKGRLTKARESYDRALRADPYKIEALLGAGEVALRERRQGEAMARFEAALNAAKTNDPIGFSGRRASVDAELGIGRVFLMLNRNQEARDKLEALSKRFPDDGEIVLWLGKILHELDKDELAEQSFRRSIALRPDVFEGYLELAQLFFTLKRPDQASQVLNEAAAKVAETAEMRRMLGQSELARNRIDNAIHEFKRALEIDPEDLDARFGLGVAFRHNGDLEKAKAVFQQVAKRDPAHAGLAVERGRLFEAQGEYLKAIENYRSALERDPQNTDLMLRIGAAQVEANNLEAATETLNKVVAIIPNSAEAEHLIGRIAFARGRTPEALVHFDRALSLDGSRAEYHLYAGRAALEMSNLGKTLEEAQAAIDRDSSIGDAYRLRGIVRLKTGAVQDALKDLERALVLSPNRYETYAAMGDCYEEMRRIEDAVHSYRKVLEFDPDNGYFWYRLGVLELDSSKPTEARHALSRATTIGDAMTELPKWLPDAHLLMGNTLRLAGKREAAIEHYKRYLVIASPSAIDRQEVVKNLRRWGIELQ